MQIETRLINYDRESYPLAEIVAAWLGCGELDQIHEGVDYPRLTRATDQKTIFHERFYAIGEDFFAVYRALLRDVVQEVVGEPLIHQRIPSFRVHFPGNVAVGEFHRDGDYAHGDEEINVWLPLTRAWDTNTIWIESEVGARDFAPYACEVGEALVFDGVHLEHGNKPNRTSKTRVSLDFRVIPESRYVPRESVSINTGLSFSVGGYFARLDADDAIAPEGSIPAGVGGGG
jgi:hypothetical protein